MFIAARTYNCLQHATRVLKILQLEDQFDGLVYCDYSHPEFCCKPEPEFFFDVRDEYYAAGLI